MRCSVVCPSYFRTRLIENMQGTDTAVGQVIGGLVAAAPLGPEDIAAAVLEGMDRGDELILPDDGGAGGVRAQADRPGGVRPGDAQAGRPTQRDRQEDQQ